MIEVVAALLLLASAVKFAHSICRAVDANGRWTTVRFVKSDPDREGRINRVLISLQRAGIYGILLLAASALIYWFHIFRR